ncbi:hypothetical protein CHU95_07140 [Niveispirillum lacus]|uniref:Uncharacterized protein n=1 Tax=Niveispirillum lacus TaxID=1981099 RepID=A0A255Z1Z4_9PROT|nr:hypothetical protein CHU95_07140 [Niveispirillum lacus]
MDGYSIRNDPKNLGAYTKRGTDPAIRPALLRADTVRAFTVIGSRLWVPAFELAYLLQVSPVEMWARVFFQAGLTILFVHYPL